VWLVGSALLAATAVLVGCAVSVAVAPVAPVEHKTYTAGTACDAAGCHDTYKHKEPYLGTCETCHNLKNWTRVTYSHKDTTFDNGMHPLIGCEMCHTEGKSTTGRTCSTCHEAPHKGWTNCTACHTTLAWGVRKQPPAGHVSLKGGHEPLACFDCHKAAATPAKARTCTNCHGTNHGGLTTCQNCHAPDTGWNPKPGWSHSDFFVIKGQHAKLECADCHKNGKFAGTPKVCVGCHGKQHGGLSDCAACHTPAGFIPPTFKHSSVFKLRGAHTKLKCSRCHPERQFARTISHGGTQCGDCHAPMHGGLTKCGDCHTTSSFLPPTFKHSSVFPLVGHHAVLACTKCHPNGQFAHTISNGSTACIACHIDDTPHPELTHCSNCHTPMGWDETLPMTHPDASVPLGPDHAWPNPCTRCHPGNVFSAPVNPCDTSGCHVVPHVGPTNCRNCHQPTAWADTHFYHPQIMNFDTTPSPSGHEYRDFGGYPSGCVKCHPSGGSNPDFTSYDCLSAGCHN
jgi:hypothetical protein